MRSPLWLGLCCAVCLLAQAQTAETAAAEQELFRDANRVRAKAGAPPLQWNQWLEDAARAHAEKMAANGQLSHQFSAEPDVRSRLAASGLHFDSAGENVASGDSAAEIQQGWMQSAGHRENLLNPKYNAVGIAVVRRGDELYAVSDFAHAVPRLSASDVENTVAATLDSMRARDGLRALRRVSVPRLRQAACDMAQKNQVDGSMVFQYAPEMRAGVAFTESDPTRFASHLEKERRSGPFSRYAVGACFARSAIYPEGTNWVLVGFY